MKLSDMKIGVLMGGISSERQVSLKTGSAVLDALISRGLVAVGIDVGRDLVQQLAAHNIDIAFIAMHGKWGEDGVIQGVLEFLDIPYTGSGVLGSALALDKIMSKRILIYHGIPTPRFAVMEKKGYCNPAWATTRFPGIELADPHRLGYPRVVKPACEGSTVGASIVQEATTFDDALSEAFRYGDRVLIEEYIAGREATVGVIDGRSLPVVEIVPKSGFYDYQAKYDADDTEYIVPADFTDEATALMQRYALATCQALRAKGAVRVDFRVSSDNEPYVLELNTIPGMTDHSLLPKAAAKAGISFDELCIKLLESAIE